MAIFENLPDEILMIIFRYVGDIDSVLCSFFGLNQRLNSILIDPRSYELFKTFNTNDSQKNLCNIAKQNEIYQYLRKLYSIQIREKYRQMEYEYLSGREHFQSMRSRLTHQEIARVDQTLKNLFNTLYNHSITLEYIKDVTKIARNGALLNCTDDELGEFNLAKAVNQYVLCCTTNHNCYNTKTSRELLLLFKSLIISNPRLVYNKDYVGNGGSSLLFFLLYAIFRLKNYYSISKFVSVSRNRYKTIVDLCIFTMQCLKNISNNGEFIYDYMMYSLGWATSIENKSDGQIIIETSQNEIMRIFIYELNQNEMPVHDYLHSLLRDGLRNIFVNNRTDFISLIFERNNWMLNLLSRPDNQKDMINAMSRKLFQQLLNDKVFCEWLLVHKTILFILLKKKACKFIKLLIQTMPEFIHTLDDVGNDPLLYVSLHVNGCRHRLIEFLIKSGSDLQRQNIYGENFYETLNLNRNTKLKMKLLEHEIINRNNLAL